MSAYQVIVGNIGTVHEGNNLSEAMDVYGEYCRQSQGNYGRAAGEDVTIMSNDYVIAAWQGSELGAVINNLQMD